jgi:hypothetical protein
MTWTVPLTSLIDELEAPVTEESLSGCAVSSEMITASAQEYYQIFHKILRHI